MKTLFVTDLDGTLLTPDKNLSERTVSIINGLLDRGMLFAVATARSPATAAPILSSLRLSLPAVLLNGVFLYDLKEKQYLDCETIPQEAARAVLAVMEGAGRLPFLYSMEDELCVEYVKLYNREEEAFYRERGWSGVQTLCPGGETGGRAGKTGGFLQHAGSKGTPAAHPERGGAHSGPAHGLLS